MSPRLLTIGRFAQLTGLTVRALRLYAELGLLRPEVVDGSSRYRYYATEQLERAELIGCLRALDMPLDEIGRFLGGDASDRGRALACHRERLRARAATVADALRAVDEVSKELAMPTDQRTPRVTPMVLKTLREQPVLRIRATKRVGEPVGSAIAEVFETILRQGRVMVAPPYFSGSEPDEGIAPFEAGIPVDSPGLAEGRVEPGVLGGGEVATTLYRGPYQGLAVAYRELWAQIEAAQLSPNGDPREVYLTSPDATPNPDDYLTEVVWPVGS
jgi:DNA-binding transcriptional MerR regulator